MSKCQRTCITFSLKQFCPVEGANFPTMVVMIITGKEGLVHVSELSHEYVKDPSQIVRVGDRINVQVLSFNKKKRRIDLSVKALLDAPEPELIEEMVEEVEEEEVELQTAMEIALRRALGKEPNAEDRSASARRGRRRKQKLREQQEDILSRTLTQKVD